MRCILSFFHQLSLYSSDLCVRQCSMYGDVVCVRVIHSHLPILHGWMQASRWSRGGESRTTTLARKRAEEDHGQCQRSFYCHSHFYSTPFSLPFHPILFLFYPISILHHSLHHSTPFYLIPQVWGDWSVRVFLVHVHVYVCVVGSFFIGDQVLIILSSQEGSLMMGVPETTHSP